MRVLHVTRDFPPHANGGISIAVGGLVRASKATSLESAVISFDGYRPSGSSSGASGPPRVEQTDNVVVLRVQHPGQLQAARNFGIDFRPQALHCHHAMLWEFTAGLRAQLQVPAVKTMHLVQGQLNRMRGLTADTMSSAAEQKALVEADCIIAPSQAAARALKQMYPQTAARLVVIGLGIDDHPAGQKPDRDPAGLLYVGRFGDIKGSRELIDLIPRILSERSRASFHLAGGLPESPRRERRWLRKLHAALSPDQQRRFFFHGWLAQDELSQLYGQSSILIVPSWFETFGLTALEGMLHGLAVISTQCGGPEELLEHDKSGLLVPVGDVDALQTAVLSLLDQPLRAAELGLAAARQARRIHAWQTVVEKHLRLYRNL
jgi:glycosyltransferase involved in cell wall biosynthesis